MDVVTQKIKAMGLVLPPPPKPAGSYVPVVVCERLVFVSGQLARQSDGSVITGTVGRDLTVERGREAARAAALAVLSVLDGEIGFPRMERILKVTGYIQAAPDFFDLSSILNGASDLFVEIFGEAGRHARAVAGVRSLPLGSAVELEVTVRLVKEQESHEKLC
jgi:enamine deaminase RidA (YjgF/YER057c/UK114 family)